MKILHTALMKSFTPGIVNQMYDELTSAKELKIDLDVKIFSPYQEVPDKFEELFEFCNISTNKSKIGSWFEYRKSYYSWLKSKENDVDYYILRYTTYDFLQYLFIKNAKKPVYLVHHTKELDELCSLGFKGKILSILDRFFGNRAINASSGIIGVTDEIVEYEKLRIKNLNKKNFIYPNGIKFRKFDFKDRRGNDVPEFLFVASYFYDWHGLDLLIKAVKESNQNIIIHIIGKVSDIDYRNMLIDERFKYHGALTHEQILIIAEQCWLGLGSFALYRKNMKQACTLKVREYLSMGLPTYSGYEDIFPDGFKFYKFDSVDMDKIVRYAKEIRKYSKDGIIKEALPYISKDQLLLKLLCEIANNSNESLERVI
ncbi:hypothetical protein [Acinetobacter lactucae]|uniref:hypothetical protein n=1 Tax=Acinetobacter lactucae TaxID=1785128 RepID=UPI00077E2A87|nr:hypothetical protein [Acinetobacter lactucae]